jgi:NAD(P)H dehydrogenase (quinone)
LKEILVGKILVLYDSQGGYTAKMAQYVAEGAAQISGHEIRIRLVDEATKEDILWADGLAVGSPTHLGLLSAKMKAFWDSVVDLWGQLDGKIACAFSSSGGWGGGNELACLSLLILLMNYGFLVFGVPDYVGKQFTLHYGAVLAGEPRREVEMASCQRLGKRLAQWVAFYTDGRADQHPGPMAER